MTLIFAPWFLAKNRVPDFLKVQDPKKISGRPDKLDIKVQIDWAIVPILCTKFFSEKGNYSRWDTIVSRYYMGYWLKKYGTCFRIHIQPEFKHIFTWNSSIHQQDSVMNSSGQAASNLLNELAANDRTVHNDFQNKFGIDLFDDKDLN